MPITDAIDWTDVEEAAKQRVDVFELSQVFIGHPTIGVTSRIHSANIDKGKFWLVFLNETGCF